MWMLIDTIPEKTNGIKPGNQAKLVSTKKF